MDRDSLPIAVHEASSMGRRRASGRWRFKAGPIRLSTTAPNRPTILARECGLTVELARAAYRAFVDTECRAAAGADGADASCSLKQPGIAVVTGCGSAALGVGAVLVTGWLGD